MHAGSSTQLIDISISNCIRSGVNKLCASFPHPTHKTVHLVTGPPRIARWQVSPHSSRMTLSPVAWCRYVLTQFNSHALNTHLSQAYPPAVFGGPQKQGFVDVLAAHQTPTEASWYRGSADAVRRNLPSIFEDYRGSMLPDDLLILSGQALYRMVTPSTFSVHYALHSMADPLWWNDGPLHMLSTSCPVPHDEHLRLLSRAEST